MPVRITFMGRILRARVASGAIQPYMMGMGEPETRARTRLPRLQSVRWPRRTHGVTRRSRPLVARKWAGPRGPEPTRFGDWEVKGIASDF